jgi:hypothetical protein
MFIIPYMRLSIYSEVQKTIILSFSNWTDFFFFISSNPLVKKAWSKVWVMQSFLPSMESDLGLPGSCVALREGRERDMAYSCQPFTLLSPTLRGLIWLMSACFSDHLLLVLALRPCYAPVLPLIYPLLPPFHPSSSGCHALLCHLGKNCWIFHFIVFTNRSLS